MRKHVYGLGDANRGFHLSLSSQFQGSGCERSLLDPAMFLLFQQETTRDAEEKDLEGISVSHVDDILHTGTDLFEEKVIIPLKKTLRVGSEEEECFRYDGMNMV